MKKHIIWPVIVTIIIALICVPTIFYFYQQWSHEKVIQENKLANLVKNENEEEIDLKTIIHEAQKTVVQIEAEFEEGQSIGSGFIYNDNGDILTNAHVINRAHSIYVKTSDAKIYPAALIGIDVEKDVAVIRVPQLQSQSFLQVDPDFEAEIGDEIIAVGSPLGFQNTVTTGIISGKHRNFSVEGGYEYEDTYQISASITSGNSGGPLIHQKTGKIIAINSAGTKEGTIGFSIPIGKVMDMAQMWSDQAENQSLNFDGDTRSVELTPEQLEDDANYIVNYFYENLNIRDYFTAYTLIGSNWQEKTSYQDFRSQYIHAIEFKINNVITELIDQNRVKITVQTDNYTRNNEQKQLIEHIEANFIVGYENDQLKILDSTRKILTTTEIELPDEN